MTSAIETEIKIHLRFVQCEPVIKNCNSFFFVLVAEWIEARGNVASKSNAIELNRVHWCECTVEVNCTYELLYIFIYTMKLNIYYVVFSSLRLSEYEKCSVCISPEIYSISN